MDNALPGPNARSLLAKLVDWLRAFEEQEERHRVLWRDAATVARLTLVNDAIMAIRTRQSAGRIQRLVGELQLCAWCAAPLASCDNCQRQRLPGSHEDDADELSRYRRFRLPAIRITRACPHDNEPRPQPPTPAATGGKGQQQR
ncbi:hypothetical protein PTSG_00399 [Salpingoeca rosetta]|uniref:Uncharacterized protein n=1 Tax=Salpingoeca rosetta (strain ATCC 50818 / BSB-021) TaxID=946362 RepID=F2TWD4_SALR5|nr:uncharacterized protein PTSG_00399 [Salpingoeca rosetta]EGD72380.1 hypothetical protein PTSG_00399 [Salpingoeca rosetta]|eukprot:XP_004998949.1 hypothetical protein PTSG_00399 [Salpingoeca rosetta]